MDRSELIECLATCRAIDAVTAETLRKRDDLVSNDLLDAAGSLTQQPPETLLTLLCEHLLCTVDRVRLSQMPHDPAALNYLTARDAWDYLLLPLQMQSDGTLLICTTEETLGASLTFLLKTLEVPFELVLSDIQAVEQYVAEQYRYEGLDLDAGVEAA